MQQKIEQLKALGEPNRFRIMMMLRSRPLCVCEMLKVLDVSGATLSSHLKILRFAGLVESNRDGKWIEYQIKSGGEQFVDTLYEDCEDQSVLDADTEALRSIDRTVCSL